MLQVARATEASSWSKTDSIITIDSLPNDEPSTTITTATTGHPSNETTTNTQSSDNLIATAQELLTLSKTSTRWISSPYTNPSNLLNLTTLGDSSLLFSLALTNLTTTRPDYATAPYLDSFNWPQILSTLRALSDLTNQPWTARKFYVVVFRSQLKPGIDRERLGLLDQKSHEEACESGGLLKYWFGAPDGERRNLATCLWHEHDDAVAGGKGPWHAQARLAARTMYESITFQTYLLCIEDGAKEWHLEDFQRK